MNIYRQELRRSRLGLLLWTACQAALICMGYFEFVAVFKGNADVADLLRQMPAPFMAMMGTSVGVDFTVVGDFFFMLADFGFYVMAAYACLLGFRVVSREETGNTTEFLYTKPVSRRGVLLWKGLAGLTCCAVMGLVTVAVTAVTFGGDPGGELLIPTLVWGGTSILLEVVYFLAGVMFAAACAKPSTGTAFNLIFLAGTILASRVAGFLDLRGPLLALSAKHYFPMMEFVKTGTFGVWPWVMCAVWCVLFVAVALWRYEKRDL